MPTVFVPTEIRESETRAAANPDSVARLVKLGMSVQVQAGAGAGSQISDQAFEAAGATIVIRDDLGGAVGGATVTVTFTGDVSETQVGSTGSDGSVTFESSGTKKGRFRWQVCVTDVSASLPYDCADNNETCDRP